MGQPVFRVSAKHKQTGERVDLFPIFDNEGRLNAKLDPGTVIKVTTKYDKEVKGKVTLATPLYITAEDYFINVYENEHNVRPSPASAPEPQHPVVAAATKTFRGGVDFSKRLDATEYVTQPGRAVQARNDDLPF